MRHVRKKKVRLNLKKFIPFVIVLGLVVVLAVKGVTALFGDHKIIGSTNTDIEKEQPDPPAEPTYETINIMCIGDVMAHMDQVDAAKQSDDTYDFSDVFTDVAPILKGADLALANIETTFSGDGTYSGYPGFDSPDILAKNVADMGIDVALFANNHMLDTKLAGAKRTVQVLNDAGMTVVGARTDTNNNRSAIVNVKGVKIGIVAYTYETEMVNGKRTMNGSTASGMDGAADYINTFRYYKLDTDKKKIADEIAWCKDGGAAFVICYLHWGNEYKTKPANQDVELARYLAENGADVIFASHPHVLQKAEVIEVGDFEEVKGTDGSIQVISHSKKVPIFYSMGNFVSNQRTETLKSSKGEDTARKTEEGMIAELELKVCLDDGSYEITKVSYIPTWVDKTGEKGNYSYRVIPLVDGFENNAFLKASGHSSRAKKALEEIKGIVNLVTTL